MYWTMVAGNESSKQISEKIPDRNNIPYLESSSFKRTENHIEHDATNYVAPL